MPDTTADEDDPKPAARDSAPGRSDPLPPVPRRGRAAKIFRLAATGVILLAAILAAAFV